MSFHETTKPHDPEPDGLKSLSGTPILDASVEATGRATDLCTGHAPLAVARERILVWLAEGAREVTWALCSLPRERWTDRPPAHVSQWPALRHVRHLVLRESYLTLPAVRQALADAPPDAPPDACASTPTWLDFEHADAAWDAAAATESAEAIVHDLGEARFELLQRLEAAPDAAWETPLSVAVDPTPGGGKRPVQLDWLLLEAHQHELEHLAAIWNIALSWDRVPRTPAPGVPLHPADRLQESH
jgi:hypothetical protein